LTIWKVETHRRMILHKLKSSRLQNLKVRLRNEPYLFINIFFAGVIVLIVAYSGFFSPDTNNYPVACIHEKLTGIPCVSCGLSHSFSLILRGRIGEAYQWNLYGMRVFLFFAGQLILRVVFSIRYIKHPETSNQLIITDCIGSGLIFLIAFWPFLVRIFSDFF
jgi:hypothetical protein